MRCLTLRSLLPFALLALGAALPASLSAQASTSAPAAVSALAGPRVLQPAATWGITPTPADLIPLPQTRGRSNSVALMAVGGAAIVVGSIIGGDGGTLIAVGGAVIGLYGLYEYLK